MTDTSQYIAIDLGAESGRVMLGKVDTERMSLEEVHRFKNDYIEEDGILRWDFHRLFSEVKEGIGKAVQKTGEPIRGIGIDSWGVDFGLVDGEGNLIENPYCYRDSHIVAAMESAFEIIPKREIYERTGIQFLPFNTIYQLLGMLLSDSAAPARAERLIFMADLFAYYLTGQSYGEYTLASTSGLMSMKTGRWSVEIFDKLGLPIEIMPELVTPGTVIGKLRPEIAEEIGCERIPVIAVASHDTACAVAAVPAEGEDWAFLSSGTWTLIGLEVPEAIINDKTFEYSFTNEGGVDDKILLLKNIMGLWLVQQCKRTWQEAGEDFSYAELIQMAYKARSFTACLEPDHLDFLSPGNMPERINSYLKAAGYKPVSDKGLMIRIILESLSFKYRRTIERIEEVAGKCIETLHIVGGGIRNELLCQLTANATAKKVVTGPAEATAIGNIIMQAMASGEIESLSQARQIVRNSFELKKYQPQDTSIWQEQFRKAVKFWYD